MSSVTTLAAISDAADVTLLAAAAAPSAAAVAVAVAVAAAAAAVAAGSKVVLIAAKNAAGSSKLSTLRIGKTESSEELVSY
jgi:hypothetical protein